MKQILLLLLIAGMMSCSKEIKTFSVPVNGKDILDNWESIVENAQPCEFCGGEAILQLFKVKFPKFSLIFTRSIPDKFIPWEDHFSVYREMNGEIFDYNIFVCMAGEGSYLSKTEFSHVTENIEMPPADNKIPISDTGLVIPSRQPGFVFPEGWDDGPPWEDE